MSNISVIEINDDADKIDVDKNGDKIFTFDDINDEPHNGEPITRIEISPNEKYLVSFSKKDCSIVGWNIEDIDKVQLKFDQIVKRNYEIEILCVSDDKLLAYFKYDNINIIDMNNKDKEIALSFGSDINPRYFTFNLKGEFILYGSVLRYHRLHKIISIYSTQTKNNKWECKRFYKILRYHRNHEIISISKYDKVYLFSNDCIYEWNINTERNVKIFFNNKDKNKSETKNIGISSNEKFIFLKINDKIIVYSIELGITIASLDINDDIQLYNFMNHTDIQLYNFINHTGLFLLPSVFYYTPDKEIKYCWNSKYKNRFNQTLFDDSTDEQTKFVFEKRVWKSKFYENMSKTKVIKCDDDDKKTYKHLNVHLFNPYMDTVSTLFQNATCNSKKELTESIENLIKWEIYADDDKIRLKVFKKINIEWELFSMRIENYPYRTKYINIHHVLIVSSLFNINDIVILTTFGILIYTFSENNKSISLNYFYFMNFDHYRYEDKKYMEILQHNKRIFSKSTLPLPNYD
ncbi:hypothetical protein RhiirA5_423257, partial [Rhizophagus irregularis]